MRMFSKAMLLCGVFFALTSCGGKDYSANPYIREYTTYYELRMGTSENNYFTFRKDGTGKLQLGQYTYDLVFEMVSDNSASLEWNKAKMGTGTFSTDERGFREFNWNGKVYVS